MKTYKYTSQYFGAVDIRLRINRYACDKSLYISAESLSEDGDWWEPFATLTKSLCVGMADETHAFLDTNNLPGVDKFVEQYGLGKPTGQVVGSGWCEYPLYEFDPMKLAEIAAEEEED